MNCDCHCAVYLAAFDAHRSGDFAAGRTCQCPEDVTGPPLAASSGRCGRIGLAGVEVWTVARSRQALAYHDRVDLAAAA